MKQMYILTAIFKTRYGSAKKFFDGRSWHWMMNSDKPILYKSIACAQKAIQKIDEADELEGLSIKEIKVYKELWESKIGKSKIKDYLNRFDDSKEVIFSHKDKYDYYFVTSEKKTSNAILLEGLYCTNRKKGIWIYVI
jgi:hypothetical protein